MFSHFIFRYFLSFVFFFVLVIPLQFVDAQSAGTGIGIKPATIEDNAVPGTVQEYDIAVSNLSSSKQIYYLYKRDIVGVEDGGVPVFADPDQEKTGFELTGWITLGQTEIELEPGQEKSIHISIDVPEDATPGSHFGGIFVTLDPPRMRSTGAAVGYEVANIISIRVAGDAVENAQIRSFSTDNYIHGESLVDFRARIENKGTVLVRPSGPLEIFNMFGKRVALVTFNESKAGIFPLTTREFEIQWEDEGPGFGRYQAILSLVYGQKGRQATISSTLSFWILPMSIIGPALGVLAVLLLVTFISIKLYVRKTLQGMSGSRRLVRRRKSGGISALLLVAVVMLAVTALFLIILLALFA